MMETKSHAFEIRASDLYVNSFRFDVDLQRNEDVIIRSAEQRGIVLDVLASSVDNTVIYRVAFPYASVYIDDAGYDSDCAWFPREALRKIS